MVMLSALNWWVRGYANPCEHDTSSSSSDSDSEREQVPEIRRQPGSPSLPAEEAAERDEMTGTRVIQGPTPTESTKSDTRLTPYL